MNCLGVALCLGCIATATTVQAEQVALAGRPANLTPVKATELTLRSETVDFSFVPDQQAWAVNAHYELSNPSAAQVTTELGLAEYGCAADSEFEDACDPTRPGFSELDAILRDRTVHLRKRKLTTEAGPNSPESLWTLPLRLLPNEQLPIEQHYVVPAGPSSDGGYTATFLMRNNTWSKLGRATFKFSFPARSCLVVEPEHIARKSRRVVLHDNEPWLELTYEAYSWTTPSDLELYFEPCLVVRDTENPGCPAIEPLVRFFYQREADEESEPVDETSLRASLAKLNDDELTKCRDAVFSAYASYFQESELKKLPSHPESSRHYTAPLLTNEDWSFVRFMDPLVAQRSEARAARDAAARKAAAATKRGGGCGCQSLGAFPLSETDLAFWLASCGWLVGRARRKRAGN